MNTRKVLILLSAAGFIISMFLAYQYNRPEPVFCITEESSCDIVRSSSYSSLLGIRLPYLGAFYFLFLMSYLYIRGLEKYTKSPDFVLFAIILVGLFFETTYTYIQIFVLETLCFWCLMIELIMLIMATIHGLSLMGELKGKDDKSKIQSV